MSEKMMEYTKSQPEVWQTVMHSVQNAMEEFVVQVGTVKTVVIIGTGSSLYSARCAAGILQGVGGIRFFTAEPTRLAPFDTMINECVYWAVSQSGKSTSTKAAVHDLCARGARVFCFTADENERIDADASGYVHVPCGEETVPAKTKGMTAISLALYVAGQACARAQGACVDATSEAILKKAFNNANENIARSLAFTHEHMATLKSAPAITMLASGNALPIAQEAALKLTETLYIPVCAYELEEYLHGVYNIIQKGALHIFLIESETSAPRFNALYQYCCEHECECLLVGKGEYCSDRKHSLRLELTGDESTFIYEALPAFHVMCAEVSSAKGIQCDKPRYPDFYARLATKEGAV